jgi:hypothetical protein
VKRDPKNEEASSALGASLDALDEQLRKEGVLLTTETLAPSKRATRLTSGEKRKWTDGPFTESKEMIAGFSILNLPDRQAAIEWANRYAEILGGNEVDVIELEGARNG